MTKICDFPKDQLDTITTPNQDCIIAHCARDKDNNSIKTVNSNQIYYQSHILDDLKLQHQEFPTSMEMIRERQIDQIRSNQTGKRSLHQKEKIQYKYYVLYRKYRNKYKKAT